MPELPVAASVLSKTDAVEARGGPKDCHQLLGLAAKPTAVRGGGVVKILVN